MPKKEWAKICIYKFTVIFFIGEIFFEKIIMIKMIESLGSHKSFRKKFETKIYFLNESKSCIGTRRIYG